MAAARTVFPSIGQYLFSMLGWRTFLKFEFWFEKLFEQEIIGQSYQLSGKWIKLNHPIVYKTDYDGYNSSLDEGYYDSWLLAIKVLNNLKSDYCSN